MQRYAIWKGGMGISDFVTITPRSKIVWKNSKILTIFQVKIG